MVKAFLQEGATVHYCSRTKSDVDAANKRLAEEYPNAASFAAVVDISDEEQLRSWVTSCGNESGRIDVVVANASALQVADNMDCWKNMFQIDLLGTYTLVQTALPFLEKTKGNIITVSSVSGRDIDFTAPGPYGSLKAALIHYTASLARSLAPKGIRANTISPGNIYIADGVWGNNERNYPDLFSKQFASNPMGRMGKPEEIADAVLFLASERAGFISGANLVADGALCTGVQF